MAMNVFYHDKLDQNKNAGWNLISALGLNSLRLLLIPFSLDFF